MKIVICGSLKFFEQMQAIADQLTKVGHTPVLPVNLEGVNYWDADASQRVAAKQAMDLIRKHMREIVQADAILVVNITKGEILNYIGGNTFLEMGFAHYHQKRMFLLNPLPDQPYIQNEVDCMGVTVLYGDLVKIPTSTTTPGAHAQPWRTGEPRCRKR